MVDSQLRRGVPLRPYTLLRAGGDAEEFGITSDINQLAVWIAESHAADQPLTILGWGSNVLPSDAGVPGRVIRNETSGFSRLGQTVEAESGLSFQDFFLRCTQAGLGGTSYAVGIPGSLGGALVSNAGAYRGAISEHLVALEVVRDGHREWVSPDVLEFSYRDSILRKPQPPKLVVLRLRFELPVADAEREFDLAREWQRQRISKQPPNPSAGSFFKNVIDADLAQRLETLPPVLREKGIIPAGYLIEQVGLKGTWHYGAQIGERHANFLLNRRNARASAIRDLAEHAKERVRDAFGVELEEECLYLGDWSGYRRRPVVSTD